MPDFGQLLRQLDDWRSPYPTAAIQALRDHRDEAAPVLRQVLHDVLAEPYAFDQRIVHLHAAALLAEWRDADAHALLAELCRLDEEASETVWCDFTTEGLPECLVATFAGDPQPLLAAIVDDEAYTWGRTCALHALGRVHCEGRCDRVAVTVQVLAWAEARADALRVEGQQGDEVLAAAAMELAPMLPLDEVQARILPWFDSGLATRGFVDLDRLRELAGDLDGQRREGDKRYTWSSAEALTDYLHHNQPEPPPLPVVPTPRGEPRTAEPAYHIAPAPYRREGPKVGRNDPCPCGSGKKFKKCCGK